MRASDLMELLEAFYGDDGTDGEVLVSINSGMHSTVRVVNSVECRLDSNNIILEIDE